MRELLRIKRDREERLRFEQEAKDIERRRTMTDAEIAAENAKLDAGKAPKDKGKMRFMQKYYHEGAFFTDEQKADPVFNRDFAQPTLEDRTTDRQLLPAVLQVKKFGMKGRTKCTLLLFVFVGFGACCVVIDFIWW